MRNREGATLSSVGIAAVFAFFGVDLDGREDVDLLSRFVDEGSRGVFQPWVGVDEEAEPVTSLAGLLAGNRDFGPEVGLRLAGIGLLEIRADGGARIQELPRELANERARRERRSAELDNLGREEKGAVLDVVRSLHA